MDPLLAVGGALVRRRPFWFRVVIDLLLAVL